MAVVRVSLAVAAVGVLVLVIASAHPSLDVRDFVPFAIILSIFMLVAFIGAVARRLVMHWTGLDITWPLLLLSLLVFGVFLSWAYSPLPPAGCYTAERVVELKSVGFRLWIAWSALAILGLGAAMSQNGLLSRFAVFVFPLAIIVVVATLLMLTLGHPILCLS